MIETVTNRLIHPIVRQMKFARREFGRSFDGVSDSEAERRFGSINSIGWMIGHVAEHEQDFWVVGRGGSAVVPGLVDQVGYGRPASTPPLRTMQVAWETIARAVDAYLDTLTTEDLEARYASDGTSTDESVGTRMYRTIYHYWFHNGEVQAVRQLLGHTDLPEFVGAIEVAAPYSPEWLTVQRNEGSVGYRNTLSCPRAASRAPDDGRRGGGAPGWNGVVTRVFHLTI